MKILAIESSAVRASIAAVTFPDDTLAEVVVHEMRELPNDRKDSGPMFSTLERVIRKFGRPDRIVVGLGPGSYAGVRIAISAAFGLAAGSRTELVGCPSIVAMPGRWRSYVVIGDARRRTFFWGQVCDRTVRGEFDLLTEEQVRLRLASLGTGVPVFSADALPPFSHRVRRNFPAADILAQLAADPTRQLTGMPLEPIYLREAYVTTPTNERRERIR